LGPPGAGKGTQAGVLSKKLEIPHISTGDMLRDAVSQGSKVGKQAKSYMVKGELVPDEVVIQIVKEKLSKPGTESGFILDGFPRTQPQAEALDIALAELSKPLDLVVYFKTSGQTSVQRLSGRRVCTQCGKNYHLVNIVPKVEGICDKCGIELIQREDDKEGTVLNRLKVYQEQTKGLIQYYKDKEVLKEVPGDFNVNQLFDFLMKLFADENLL